MRSSNESFSSLVCVGRELPEHNRHLDEHLFYIELLFEEECAIREWDEVLGAFMRHF